jgi:hypothetical protein
MITVFNRFMLAVCLMIVCSMVYGFNEATDGLLLKSFIALIAAYKDQ